MKSLTRYFPKSISWTGILFFCMLSVEAAAQAIGTGPILTKLPDMVRVEGGAFTMGCTDRKNDCEKNEYPAHEVTLDGFLIGKYEVTQAEYEAVMGFNISYFGDCPDCPVENINWYEVQMFIEKLNEKTGRNYRLPTEAEWEYAARGGEKSIGHMYSGGDGLDEVAWHKTNTEKRPKRVGQKRPNELGIYDMTGNVWEWCHDSYDKNYFQSGPVFNPQGPEEGRTRVVRGGSWLNDEKSCRVSARYYTKAKDFRNGIGFRLAHDL